MTSKLNKDIKRFLNTYSKFEFDERHDKLLSVLKGEIDICDTKGIYWDSFEIEIYIDKEKYPFCVPTVLEISKKIKRHEDWHINKEGVCCVDIDHELEFNAKSGINISDFYQNKIYPFFTNTLYKKRKGHYANGEYLHDFGAVVNFYEERLNLKNTKLILKLLENIKSNTIISRNEKCFCNSNLKFKKCHIKEVNILKSLSKKRILEDIKGFNNLNN